MATEQYRALVRQQPGAFGSVLRWMDRPFQVIGNMVQGRPGASARNMADFVLEPFDAVIPFIDLIPTISKPEDETSGSEMLGLQDSHWLPKLAADIVVGSALNPMSYFTLGGAGAAGSVAKNTTRAGQRVLATVDDVLRPQAIKQATKQTNVAIRTAKRLAKEEGTEAFDMLTSTQKEILNLRGRIKAQRQDIARLLPDSPGPIPEKVAELRLSISQHRKSINDLVRSEADAILSSKVPAMQRAEELKQLPASIEAGMRRSGAARKLDEPARMQLLENVNKEILAAEAWTNKTKIANVLAKPEFRDYFRQGGTSWGIGSRRIKLPAVDNAARTASAKVGSLLAESVAHIRNLTPDGVMDVMKTLGGSPAVSAARKVPEVVTDAIRATLGINNLSAKDWATLKTAQAAGANETASAMNRTFRIFTENGVKSGDETSKMLTHAFNGVKMVDGVPHLTATGKLKNMVEKIGKTGESALVEEPVRRTLDMVLRDIDEMAPLYPGVNRDTARKVAEQISDEGRRMLEQWGKEGVYTNIVDPFAYLMRGFKSDDVIDLTAAGKTLLAKQIAPKSTKARSIQDPVSLADHMLTFGETLDDDIVKLMGQRALQQGAAVTQTRLIKSVLGEAAENTITNPAARKNFTDTLAAMGKADKEFVQQFAQAFSGLPPRGKILKALHGMNSYFKPAAVYGMFLPRLSGIVGNNYGGFAQVLSTEGIEAAGQFATRMGKFLSEPFAEGAASSPNIMGTAMSKTYGNASKAVDKLYTGVAKQVSKSLGKGSDFGNTVSQGMRQMDEAILAAGGDRMAAMQALRQGDQTAKWMADGMESGLFNGFVTAEDLLFAINNADKTWLTATKQGANMPGVIYQHLENMMRGSLWLDLRASGVTPGVAARRVSEAFLDYSQTNIWNRTARDLIPFFSFTSGTIAQQGALMARKPGAAIAYKNLLYGSHGEPVEPWIAERPHLYLGKDKQTGESRYVTSMRLPIEAMDWIPNFSDNPLQIGADIERNIIGSMNPLLKLGMSHVFGRDPYFGSVPGSYRKPPGWARAIGVTEERPAWGTYHQVMGSGMVQPVASATQVLNRMLDPDKPIPERLLNTVTGVRTARSNPDRALVNVLQNRLSRDPDARQFISYYGGSEATDELLDQIKQARSRLREQRKALNEAEGVR